MGCIYSRVFTIDSVCCYTKKWCLYRKCVKAQKEEEEGVDSNISDDHVSNTGTINSVADDSSGICFINDDSFRFIGS